MTDPKTPSDTLTDDVVRDDVERTYTKAAQLHVRDRDVFYRFVGAIGGEDWLTGPTRQAHVARSHARALIASLEAVRQDEIGAHLESGAVPDTGQAQAREGLPSVPDEMWLTSDWGVIESDGSGAWRTIENGSYVEHLPAGAVRLVSDSPAGVLDRWRELGGALTGFLIILEQEGVQLPPRAERGRAVVSDLLANAWEDAAGGVPDPGQTPDVAALLRRLDELAERWELPLTKRTEAVALAYCTAARDLRRALAEEANR